MNVQEILDTESRSDRKQYVRGTHRVRSPEETFERVRPHFGTMGITRVANVTGLDYVGIPVWQCVRPNSRSLAVSQGKGVTDAAARASAVMESIEVWHAERVSVPLRMDSYFAMSRTVPTIDIDLLVRRRVERPRRDLGRLWCEGWDLITKAPMWVPYTSVSMSMTDIQDPDLLRSTNGLSSGNTLGEAVVHGICETIERDAWQMWVASDAPPSSSQLNLDTVTDPECRSLIDKLRDANQVIAAYDVTSDVRVPVYSVIIGDRPGGMRVMGRFYGAGCHLEPAVALSRALSEAAQSRATWVAGSRDDVDEDSPSRVTTAELEAFESEVEGQPAPRSFDRLSTAKESPSQDADFLISRLRECGIKSVVAVAITRPGIDIPVVKVIPTQLEGPEGAAPNVRRRELLSLEDR